MKPIHKRRILNVSKHRQKELCAQYPWLNEVDSNNTPTNIKQLSVTVFDHMPCRMNN